MKPYIAKLLPITKDFLGTNDVVYVCRTKDDLQNQEFPVKATVQKFEHETTTVQPEGTEFSVELPTTFVRAFYVCSYQLKIGDKFYSIINNRISSGIIGDDYDKKWKIATSFAGVYVEKSEAYKIIGKVSPDVTWLKDGMEFDMTEIEPWYYDEFQDDFKGVFIAPQDGQYDHIYDIRIKVKCPCCGRFQ